MAGHTLTPYEFVATRKWARKEKKDEHLLLASLGEDAPVDLLDAIEQALQRDRARRENWSRLTELRRRFRSLTPREREVMAGVVEGKLNKQIASELKTVEKTIKFHRAHVMQKMEANSLAALVQMAAYLEMFNAQSQQ